MRISVYACTLLATCCLTCPLAAGELPESLKKKISKAADEWKSSCDENRATLLASFDKAMNQLKKNGLSGDARVRWKEILDKEKAAFERDGTVPFSVPMRPYTLRFLQTRIKDERPVHLAYEAAFKHCEKSKDEELGRRCRKEKNTLLAPIDVASWECEGGRWGFVLRSDGTSGGKSKWSLKDDKIIFNNHDAPNAPAGGFVDNCVLSEDGQEFSSYGTPGGTFKGKLLPLKK